MAKQQSGVDPATITAQQAQDATGAIAGEASASAAAGAVHGRRKQKRAERQAYDQAQNTQTIDGCIQEIVSSRMTGHKVRGEMSQKNRPRD